MSLEPNTTEFGHELPIGYRLEEFEIKSILGSGGFGITYLAKDVDLKREVVVKENLPFQCALRDSTRSVRPRTSSEGDRNQFEWALQSFLREAETLSRFDHPNIVRVLRRFEANNTAYFVMPYLPGKSLKQVIEEQVAKDQGFTEQRLKDLLYPLLDALEALHQEGVYHRDIKAANILLVTGHRPILIDFGAARQVISEKSHTVVESAGYTPFEQLQSHGNVGPWSDIYSLGGTFYTAIHGEPPPRASDRMRRDPIVNLSTEYGDHYSKPFLQALDWALRVDETERPQSVAAWREAFRTGIVPFAATASPSGTTGVQNLPVNPSATVVPPPTPMPAPAPKKVDAAPFPWMFLGKIIGSVFGALLGLGVAWHFLQPLFVTPGSLVVNADPSTATVKISGQAPQPVPASFPRLRVGSYQVTISAPGYDPVSRTIEIKEGQAFPWQPVQLQRAHGSLNLTGVPPHASYSLSPASGNDAKEYHGRLPATLANIPAGAYTLSLSSGDLQSGAIPLQVDPHRTTTSNQDLIKAGVSQGADPAVASALTGQGSPSQLNDAQRKSYDALSTQVIDSYLHYHLFPQAAAQIAVLAKLGENTQTQQAAFDQARQAYETTGTDQIRSLLARGQFGATQSKIDEMSEQLGTDAGARLRSEFQPQLDAYMQKEQGAIQAASTGNPAQGYAQLSTFVQQYPDDIPAQLALADLSRQLPPDHDRLSMELKNLRSLSTQDLDTDQASKIQEAQAAHQNELTTYDSLLEKLNEAKQGTGPSSARIAQLERRIGENRRQIAVGDNVNTAVNAVTGLFGQHVHVETTADREAAIERDQAEIARLQAAQQASATGSDAAQRAFDDFCQHVPW